MRDYPNEYGYSPMFRKWKDYHLKHSFGAVQEHLELFDYCDRVRKTPFPSHWISEKGKNFYTASVDIFLPRA